MKPTVILLSALSLLFVLSASTTKAQSVGKDSLQGLKGVYVVVEEIEADVEQRGLTKNQLLTDTELRLRKAGIRVPQEAASFASDIGTLFISLVTQVDSRGLVSYHISLELAQMVYLVRAPSKRIPANTYELNGALGTIGVERLKELRSSVGDRVDAFINDYLAANPK